MNDNVIWTKHGVSKKEADMYCFVYKLGIVNIPDFISYNDNGDMTTVAIDSVNVADMYTDDAKKVDSDVFEAIRSIVKTLYSNGIVYPDITGYNFIEHKGKVWIIDFEHAHLIGDKEEDPFVEYFIKNTKKEWNPTFL